jgi:hypothetical protein
MALTTVVTIQSTNEAASLKRVIGYVTVAGVTTPGTEEESTIDVGLRSCKFINFTGRMATNQVELKLQDDTTLPATGSAVPVSVNADGVAYFEALGTGS